MNFLSPHHSANSLLDFLNWKVVIKTDPNATVASAWNFFNCRFLFFQYDLETMLLFHKCGTVDSYSAVICCNLRPYSEVCFLNSCSVSCLNGLFLHKCTICPLSPFEFHSLFLLPCTTCQDYFESSPALPLSHFLPIS